MLFDDATAGSKLAMGALACCYENGKGIPQAYLGAYVWFSVAAAFGLTRASQDRDRVMGKLPSQHMIEAQQQAAVTFDAISRNIPNIQLERM